MGPRESLLAVVKRRKLAWLGHVTRHDSLSKPLLRASWMVGDAVVDRGNAGLTTSKNEHPCPCQNRSQRPPAGKKTKQKHPEKDLCWIDPPPSPWRPNQSSDYSSSNLSFPGNGWWGLAAHGNDTCHGSSVSHAPSLWKQTRKGLRAHPDRGASSKRTQGTFEPAVTLDSVFYIKSH